MSGHLASQTSDLVLPNQARGFDPLPDPDPLAHEAWDPYAITSTETSKEAHTCGQRTFWLMYPGSAPHSFTKLCHSWHCYTKTKEATCVERKVAIYEHRMRRNPLFDGWEAVYLLAVPDESHKLIARPDGVLKWQRGAGDFDAVRKLAKRRDVKWLRLPRFEGVGFIFADGDLTAKGSTRPILRLTVEDARELVMTVLRGHDVRGQPSTSANYPYNFSFPRSDSDDDGPKSFLLPGAHPLIIDRTWALFSGWTQELCGVPAGPDCEIPRDADGPLWVAMWKNAKEEAAEEMGWETSGVDHVYEHFCRVAAALAS